MMGGVVRVFGKREYLRLYAFSDAISLSDASWTKASESDTISGVNELLTYKSDLWLRVYDSHRQLVIVTMGLDSGASLILLEGWTFTDRHTVRATSECDTRSRVRIDRRQGTVVAASDSVTWRSGKVGILIGANVNCIGCWSRGERCTEISSSLATMSRMSEELRQSLHAYAAIGDGMRCDLLCSMWESVGEIGTIYGRGAIERDDVWVFYIYTVCCGLHNTNTCEITVLLLEFYIQKEDNEHSNIVRYMVSLTYSYETVCFRPKSLTDRDTDVEEMRISQSHIEDTYLDDTAAESITDRGEYCCHPSYCLAKSSNEDYGEVSQCGISERVQIPVWHGLTISKGTKYLSVHDERELLTRISSYTSVLSTIDSSIVAIASDSVYASLDTVSGRRRRSVQTELKLRRKEEQ
ncbi:hypothetical protein Tco_0486686 [Tanacetum coccineum]